MTGRADGREGRDAAAADVRWRARQDPFCGSGTAIIAAEKLGRACFALELDPKYAQVIVTRWEGFTGQKAVRQRVTRTKASAAR